MKDEREAEFIVNYLSLDPTRQLIIGAMIEALAKGSLPAAEIEARVMELGRRHQAGEELTVDEVMALGV